MEDIFSYLIQVWEFKLFELNETPVSISSVAMFVLVISLFWAGSSIFGRVILEGSFSQLRIDEGTRYNLRRIIHYIFMLVGLIIAFQFIGVDLSGLAVIFGLLSVGIGFGLQNVTSNFVSGIIVLIERPIRVGDRVTVGDVEGDVLEINMRSTTIRSLNNISIIVPNAEFVSSQVINWSHRDPKVRVDINVGVSYSSDLDTVLHTLKEIAEKEPGVLNDPPPDVLHRGFSDSSWDMQLRVWIGNPKKHPAVRHAIHCAIIRTFRERGIEIPFPQRDLNIRTPIQLGSTS